MTQRFAVVGGKMTRPLGFVLALFIVGSVSPAKAGGNTNVKCAPNEDRVWVYESLDDFNVAAKLKCGDPVQIVGRVKGYVKIETANGTDGYVLDSALPKSALPPEPEEKPNTVEAASLAFAARRAAKSSANSANPAPSASSTSAVASSAPVTVASKPAPAAQPAVAPVQPQPEVTMTASAPAPAASASNQPVTAPIAAPVVATAPAPAASSAPVANAASTPPTPSQPAPVAPKAVARYSNPQPVPPSRAKKHAPTPSAPTVSAPSPTVAAVTSAPLPSPAAPVAPAPITPPAAAPVASRVDVDANNADAGAPASLQPVSTPSAHAVTPAAKPPVNPDDEEDASVKPLDDDTAGCTHYFSAYGLSPNQYKWIAQNRHKAFPSVCPAPTPSMVDFVVIFTHDVAFYNVTMPNAIHVEKNGFSDWTPLTTVDTALMNASDANKSHHEYVWVFHTNRGAFDPAKFSSRRRPLYSKSETNTLGSRGGFRTVMDALTFIESNATNP
jgi:hypothetical protein